MNSVRCQHKRDQFGARVEENKLKMYVKQVFIHADVMRYKRAKNV